RQPHEDADRPGGDLGGDRQPLGVGGGDAGEDGPVVVGPLGQLGHRQRQRPAGAGRHVAQHGPFLVDVEEVGHHLEHAAAGGGHAGGDPGQLGGGGGQAGCLLARRGAVVERAGGGEADG